MNVLRATGAQPAPGKAFTLTVHARSSARAAFREALGSLHVLDAITLRSAVADKDDRFVTGAYWARQHANDQTALGFDQYLRGTATLEDVQTGLRYNGSYFDASTIVQNDSVKYRIVPIPELLPER